MRDGAPARLLALVLRCFKSSYEWFKVSRLQPGHAFSTWPLFMAYIFLHPFDLAGYDSIHCHESQLERMHATFGASKTIYTARDVSRKLPFLLSQSAVLAPYTGLSPQEPLDFFPLEQTPLYVGTPQAYFKNQSPGNRWNGSREALLSRRSVSQVYILYGISIGYIGIGRW